MKAIIEIRFKLLTVLVGQRSLGYAAQHLLGAWFLPVTQTTETYVRHA